MTTPVSSSTASTTTGVTKADGAASSSLVNGANQGLGKDAFMKLLVAQISHQDPLKPMDDTAFVSQLAQFSSLEQTLGINTRLDALSAQERGVGNTQMAGLVGKSITIQGSAVTLDGSGLGGNMTFTLDGAPTSTTVSITNAQGKTVRTLHPSDLKAGLNKVNWDGKDDNGIVQAAGTYNIDVQAKNGDLGVGVSQESTGILNSIGFANGSPTLELDSGASAKATDLIRINSTPSDSNTESK